MLMDCHLIKDEHPKIHSFMNLIFREYLTLSRLTSVKLEAPSMFVEDIQGRPVIRANGAAARNVKL